MHMMQMLGILVFLYFFSLILLCFYRDHLKIKTWNLVFVIADIVAFFCWNYAAFQRGWLQDGFMTLENISPYICTVIPLTYLMNDKVKNACFSAVAFLGTGMFFAMLISPEYAYLFSFNAEANFLYTSEAVCHLICSLFGIYLVLSGQVKADFSHWLKSIAFMYVTITFGLFLNVCFHKNFFGMDPYGNPTIYMIDIFGTFEATLAAYYLGVLLVLTVGMQVSYGLFRITEKMAKKTLPLAEETGIYADLAEISQISLK